LAWRIEFARSAAKEFEALDTAAQRRIQRYLRERIATDADPRRFGKPLRGDKIGLWAYRVGDYRLICHIESERFVVLVLRVGHRRWVYE
jgi:mRNA interferase RelE/StbE